MEPAAAAAPHAPKPVMISVDGDGVIRIHASRTGDERIVDNHRGQVRVVSAPGETRFQVRLPIA